MYYTLYLMKYDNLMVGTVKDAAPSFFFFFFKKEKNASYTSILWRVLQIERENAR